MFQFGMFVGFGLGAGGWFYTLLEEGVAGWTEVRSWELENGRLVEGRGIKPSWRQDLALPQENPTLSVTFHGKIESAALSPFLIDFLGVQIMCNLNFLVSCNFEMRAEMDG
jgi:hypothetical protein